MEEEAGVLSAFSVDRRLKLSAGVSGDALLAVCEEAEGLPPPPLGFYLTVVAADPVAASKLLNEGFGSSASKRNFYLKYF